MDINDLFDGIMKSINQFADLSACGTHRQARSPSSGCRKGSAFAKASADRCRKADEVRRMGVRMRRILRRKRRRRFSASPQPLIGESPTGTRFQIFFKCQSPAGGCEGDIGHQFPRHKLACMFGAAVIVVGDSVFDAVGDTDVALIGVGDAADQVDVFH